MDRDGAVKAIEDFLRALGHEPTGDLQQTGQLVAEAWSNDLLAGYQRDPRATLRDGIIDFDGPTGQLVAVRRIAVTCICPHHLLPAHGHGDVVFSPRRHIAGFGSITRAVTTLAQRFALQERLTADIAELIHSALESDGALCRLELTHTCMITRGSRQTEARIVTLATAGEFQRDAGALQAALAVHGGAADVGPAAATAACHTVTQGTP